MIRLSASASSPVPTTIRPEEHLKLVCAVALPYLQPGEVLEDSEAYADGLVGLVKASQSYKPEYGTFSTWAWRAIKSHIIDGYRSRSREQNVSVSLEELPEKLEMQPDTMEEEESRTRLHVHLRLVESEGSDMKRDVKIFIYYHTVCSSWREVGKKFGIPKSTAQVRARKAEQRIRSMLVEHQSELISK